MEQRYFRSANDRHGDSRGGDRLPGRNQQIFPPIANVCCRRDDHNYGHGNCGQFAYDCRTAQMSQGAKCSGRLHYQPVHSGLSVLHHRPAIQRDALHPGHVDARRDALHADNVYAIRQCRRVAALHHDDQHKPLHYDRTLQHLPEGVQDVLDYGDDRCLLAVFLRLPTANAFRWKFGYNHQLGTCSILPDDEGRSSKTAMFIIAFIIPCMIIVICYSRIFCVVHKSDKRMKNHSKSQCNIPNNLRSAADPASPLSAGSSSSANNNSISYTASSSAVKVAGAARTAADARDAKARRNEWRITKMVLAIFLSFVMCYLPITISKIVDKNVSVPVLHIIGYIMLYLSACINPIIYVIMNKQYRQAYKTVIFCKPSRLLGFGGSSVGEMERHRVQLQPQSYHGVPSFNSRTRVAPIQPTTPRFAAPTTFSRHSR
uniref:G-protein coupled receptors family 1 profile domain-containing protein n=1 Tax=Anopheles gambiae TaxID=7165 RepID=A0A1S4GC96_ANOGA